MGARSNRAVLLLQIDLGAGLYNTLFNTHYLKAHKYGEREYEE